MGDALTRQPKHPLGAVTGDGWIRLPKLAITTQK
jgi:hypothetical protein